MGRLFPAFLIVPIFLGTAAARGDQAPDEVEAPVPLHSWSEPTWGKPLSDEAMSPLGPGAGPPALDLEELRRLGVWSLSGSRWEPGQASLHDLGCQSKGRLGSLTCWTLVGDRRARRDNPLAGGWRTDDSWKMSLAGSLFVFGSLEAGSEGLGGAEMSLIGKTGVGWKVPVPLGAEVQLRGGPSVTYNDPLRSERAEERSELFVEVLAKYPLPLPRKVGLEYQGAAIPALGTLANHRINQELRLAIPVGDSGLLKVGAKHQWEDASLAHNWTDGMQVFLGLEVKPGVGRK